MADSRTLPEDHDAQRALEQRSLRNVRSLLDRLEREADGERRTRRLIGWVLALVAVVALAGAYGWAVYQARHDRSHEIVLTPARS